MPVNFNSVHFQSFVDFAQQRFDAGDKTAVISATVTKPLDGHKILTIDNDGRLQMQFDGVQNLTVMTTDPGSGKSVTTMVGEGSTVEAHLTLTIEAGEFDRLASLDYARFDDTRANEIMADKTAENKLPSVQESFAKEFQFAELGTSMRVGLKATIN